MRAGVGLARLRRCEPWRFGRRAYVDSKDHIVSVQKMTNPMDVLDYMSQHSDADIRTYETSLRSLARLQRGNQADFLQDDRFHAILSTLANRLEDCDATMLAKISDAAARCSRTSTPELSDLAQRLAEVVCQRGGTLSPRNLATVAMALSMRGVRDAPTIEFLRKEVLKRIDDLEPAHCNILLEAFRRWGVFDRELIDFLVERMSDEVDRFTTRDLVDAVAVISRLGLARRFLLSRLRALAFENLEQFSMKQLATMSYAMARLRILEAKDLDQLVKTLGPKITELVASQISEFLFALAMVNARNHIETAQEPASRYAEAGRMGFQNRSTNSLIDFVWALAALDLVGQFQEHFTGALGEVFERNTPQNREPLLKLFDICCALEMDYADLDIKVPAPWKAACEDCDKMEMDRLENSKLHNEVMMRFNQLRASTKGMKWELQMQRNAGCGPYRVDMFDEDTKIAVDLDIVSWPTSRHMKHRLLQRDGYRMLNLQYWHWRQARTEEDQNLFLEAAVTRALEANSPPSIESS